MLELYIEYGKHLYVCYVDLKKAFDSRASIACKNILRFSQDYLRSTLAEHFQSREIGGNAQLTACCSSFSSGSVCKTIAVDGGRKGVRGGGCSRPASGSLSFSITKSVATKHPVNVASLHIARGCQLMLQLHYRHRSDAMCGGRGGVCVCGRRDGQTCVRAGRSAIIIAKALSQVSQWDWENQFNQVYPISEMTYTVSSWMLNSTIPYHQSSMCVVFLATRKEDSTESQISACTGNS